MKQNAYIAGVGMTTFGKHADRGMKSLAGEAIEAALQDAGIDKTGLEAAYMGNAAAGVITGQVCVPGQMVLRELGIGRIPVVNVENACASAATAFDLACTMITCGLYDVVLATGMEKLYHEDKLKTFSVFTGALDLENASGVMRDVRNAMREIGAELPEGGGRNRSILMDISALIALRHMQQYGTTREQLAMVSAKNSFHGSLNPRAQYQDVVSVQEVLAAREVSYPLTLPMCSPIGDGAAAVVLVSERKARELGLRNPVKVESTVLISGWDYAPDEEITVAEAAARQAYEDAGLGPDDLDCVELHDASAPSELVYYEYLGLCAKGEGGRLIEEGHTRLGGRIPVNTSGGLLRKGHPIGATGVAQIVELTDQLLGRAGKRQVEGVRVALAENGGGYIGSDAAALAVSILSRGKS